MKLPNYVQIAINLLESANFEVFVVGGAVRDFLLGVEPHDFDLSTNATPFEAKEVFKNYYTIDTGLKHGTISVMINNKILEITTYRSEEDYLDFRRPNKVKFLKNINEDLMRRDFTINSIAFNKSFLDINGGMKDLDSKVIRAIGDATCRFKEDPLRILRALRFASTLEFEIEENTEEAIHECFHLLENISIERINNEFSKLILGKNAKSILNDYKYYIEKYVLKFEILDKSINAIELLDYNLSIRLASLCLNLDVDSAYNVLSNLKYSKKQIKSVVLILENYHIDLHSFKEDMLRVLKKVDYTTIGDVLKLRRAINSVGNISLEDIESLEKIYKELNFKYLKLKDLKINGNDLIQIGFREGVEIKIILEKLLDDCINGLENEYDNLIKRAKEYLKED